MNKAANDKTKLDQFGYKQELNRVLSTRDLVVYGLIFMVPIAPYSVFGLVWNDSKGMVPLAYLIGLVGMFFTAMSYAAMSRAFPVAGSVYSYAQRGLHDIAGFFAGWLILLDYILVPALLYLFSAIALRPLLPGVPEWIWLIAFITFNATVNLIGIQFTARANRYMLVMELLILSMFIVLGLIALYSGKGAQGLTLKPVYNPAAFSLATVAGATSIAVLSFLGFDGISTLSEETHGGNNAVGRASVLSLLLVGVLFMVQTWIANAMAAQAAVSRVLFAMARDGKLPAVLARVHPRFKTPYISTLVVAGVSLLVGIFFSTHLDDLNRIVNFGALSGFLILHLSVINHFFIRHRSGEWIRHLAMPLAGFMVIAFVLYEMDRTAKIMGACWIAAGVRYYLTLTWVLKKPVSLDVQERGL